MKSRSPPELILSPTLTEEHINSAERGTEKESHATSEKRVSLACHRCRTKRARCSGDKPVCEACVKASEECTWPSGRRRKRTRREMEADERLEREREAATKVVVSMDAQLNEAEMHHMRSHKKANSSPIQWPLPDQHSNPTDTHFWQYPPQYSYVWPPAQPSLTHQLPAAEPTSLQQHIHEPECRIEKTEQIVKALETQMAFIDGDPSRQEELELYYYRFSGSTAIRPGINRISLKLHPRVSPLTAPLPTSELSVPQIPQNPQSMFDPNGFPLESIYLPLLDTFFRTMGRHFPSISRRRMSERLETRTMSAFFLNCICAIAARFNPLTSLSPVDDAVPFITKAQELLIPLLHLPTTDSVTGLLLLAWANYGQNSESGLWQYSGMAFRMALDLGLHELSEIYESAAHMVRTRLLFWSLFITDRIVAFSTGRPVSISEEIIEIPLPCDADLSPDPAIIPDPVAFQEPIQANAFQYLVRLMVLCGRIANVLNGRRGRSRTLVGPTPSSPNLLGDLQSQLVQFYAELPDSMKWTVNTFRHQEARGHGGVFLTLHLWANAVLALVYHPELLTNPSGMETPMSSSMERSDKLSLASSRVIGECLVFADLFASQSYLASPMAVQPIYVACMAFVHDMKMSVMGYHPEHQATELSGKYAELLLHSIARQNLSVLYRAIQGVEHYWAGASYVLNILRQKTEGLIELDPEGSTKLKRTFISLPDKGLLQRFSGRDLPHNTAPPTETSLRTSFLKESSSSPYTCSLDELMNMYSVEGMFIQPADSFDVDSLLGRAYKNNESPPTVRTPGSAVL